MLLRVKGNRSPRPNKPMVLGPKRKKKLIKILLIDGQARWDDELHLLG